MRMTKRYTMLGLVLGLSLCVGTWADSQNSTWNVLDFGANGDSTTDNTAAFQAAMDAASEGRGGLVTIPTGRYRFDGVLTIPDNVTLQGIYSYSPASAGIRDNRPDQRPEYGTVLEPYAGAGEKDGTPFITIMGNATLQGLTIHYPAQDPNADAPTPYPFTVAMRGNNPAILDVQLLNPFQGIDASRNQRALVRNIHGQPIAMGIFVDGIYDIGRIENVHWNPWWSIGTPVYEWQLKHGVGFHFKRTDWHYVVNTFCFGYNVGYQFSKSEAGSCNGNFLGIGADACNTAVLVEETAPFGVLITNGEFVAFPGEDPTMIRITDTHTGSFRVMNSAFWGPCNRNVVMDGPGTVGFSDCTFVQWGKSKEKNVTPPEGGFPSIDAYGGTLLVRGCEFLETRRQVHLHENVERAIISENMVNGKVDIVEDKGVGATIIKDNLAPPRGKRWDEKRKTLGGMRADKMIRFSHSEDIREERANRKKE